MDQLAMEMSAVCEFSELVKIVNMLLKSVSTHHFVAWRVVSVKLDSCAC